MKLCPYHENGLGWDTCTEGFEGCQFEEAREAEVAKMEDNKVICPVCEHVITDFEEGVSDPCEHVMVTYVDMLNGEFVYVAPEFKKEAEKMEIRSNDWDHEDGEKMLDELLEEFVDSHDGYELIELTTSGLACGPVSSTEYHLIRRS